MYSLLVLLLPSIIGLKFMDLLNKFKSIKDFIIYYLMLVLFSNYLCIFIVVAINKFNENLFSYIENHLTFSFKYLTLLIIINLLLAFIFSIIIKNFNISLEVKHEKKNSKKRN